MSDSSKRSLEEEAFDKASKILADYERTKANTKFILEAAGAIRAIVGAGADDREQWIVPGSGETTWFKDFEHGPEMVVVPAGEFIMGWDEDYDYEDFSHKVTIASPFSVSRFAITFGEWDAARLKHRPSDYGWERGRRPVIDVSWEDAKSYAAWLSQKTGKDYRLLSEAEWEYCCRAGTTTKYSFGDTIRESQAQFSAEKTVEVGTFVPNDFGCCDMHGNVWEWVEDNFHKNYEGAPSDGSAWSGGDASRRVRRGGCWSSVDLGELRSGDRSSYRPDYRSFNLGFRVARDID